MSHRYVFIGGLHRSGTSLVHRVIAADPRVTGFAGTGAPEDEGQFLQNVYVPAIVYGGPGRFGFDKRAHLTESSPLATTANRDRIVWEWSYHWDATLTVRVEKSPPNMLKMRFLQALFPDAHFVMVVRDPIAVTMSTSRWRKHSSLSTLVRHWVKCHEIMWNDAPHIHRLQVIRYEDLVADPHGTLLALGAFLGLDGLEGGPSVQGGLDEEYLRLWHLPASPLRWFDTRVAALRYQDAVRRLGYTLR
jgi:Sulfotransferase family